MPVPSCCLCYGEPRGLEEEDQSCLEEEVGRGLTEKMAFLLELEFHQLEGRKFPDTKPMS